MDSDSDSNIEDLRPPRKSRVNTKSHVFPDDKISRRGRLREGSSTVPNIGPSVSEPKNPFKNKQYAKNENLCFHGNWDGQCFVKDYFTFPDCGHETLKKCYVKAEVMRCRECRIGEDVSQFKKPFKKKPSAEVEMLCTHGYDKSQCFVKVNYTFTDCGHKTTKKCYVKDEVMKCRECKKVGNVFGLKIPSENKPSTEGEKLCVHGYDNSQCFVKVIYTFKDCGHETAKKCYVKDEVMKCRQCRAVENVSEFTKPSDNKPSAKGKMLCTHGYDNSQCFVKVNYTFNDCGHDTVKKCFVKDEVMKCRECRAVCDVLFECEVEEHRCKKPGTAKHDHSQCLSDVNYIFTNCGHEMTKKCYVKDEDLQCTVQMTKKLKCGHDKNATCYTWSFHEAHVKCEALVDYRYPGCNHIVPNHSTTCSNPAPPKNSPKCKFMLQYTSDSCGHLQKRLCSKKEKCLNKCDRQRPDCGHPCMNKCYEPCIGGSNECKLCEIEKIRIRNAAKDAAKLQIQACTASSEGIRNVLADGVHIFDLSSFNLRDISNPMCDEVQKAISLYQGDCSKRPTYLQSALLKIKSVGVAVNHKSEILYKQKKTNYNSSKQKFEEVFAYHATKAENVASIVKNNLDPGRAGTAHGTVYGHGCYFSEHPQFSLKYGKETMLIFKLLLVEGQYRKK